MGARFVVGCQSVVRVLWRLWLLSHAWFAGSWGMRLLAGARNWRTGCFTLFAWGRPPGVVLEWSRGVCEEIPGCGLGDVDMVVPFGFLSCHVDMVVPIGGS